MQGLDLLGQAIGSTGGQDHHLDLLWQVGGYTGREFIGLTIEFDPTRLLGIAGQPVNSSEGGLLM